MDYFELIEDYINNMLSDSQKTGFENEMKKNASLRKAVQNNDLAKKIAGGFIELDGAEILNDIKADRSGKILTLRNLKWFSAAAAIIVIVGSLLIFQVFSGEINNKKLAIDNYQDIVYSGTRGAGDNKNPLDEAITLYHKNHLEESNDLFRDLFGGSIEDEKIAFYLAHIEFKNENYARVDSFLNFVQGQQFLEEAMYLKALNYLAQDNLEESKKLLTSIKNLEGTLALKSLSLLGKIDK